MAVQDILWPDVYPWPAGVAASDGGATSQRIRKRIEELFLAGGLAQLKVRGLAKAGASFLFGLVT